MWIYCVFQKLGSSYNEQANSNSIHAEQKTVNAKTGRTDRIVINLEEIYPDGDYKKGNREYCLEEIRAHRRRCFDRDWRKERAVSAAKRRSLSAVVEQTLVDEVDMLYLNEPGLEQHNENAIPKNRQVKIPIFDDEAPAAPKQSTTLKPAKKSRREDRANRTQKIQILEVKAEPQTGKS